MRDLLRPQRSPARRLLITALAIAGLVVGLLAMHSLSTESHAGPMPAALMSSVTEDHVHANEPATVVAACSDDCGMGHSMLVACALALIAGVLAAANASTLSTWSALAHSVAKVLSPPASLTSPDPPSLTVLSISRT